MRRTLQALPVSVCLGISGFIHAQLYVRSYHFIHVIGPAFHWDAAASFAVAVLLLIRNAGILRLLAAGLCFSGLGGFTMSRTVGLFGFTERGWEPSPQAPLSVGAWVAALVLLAIPVVKLLLQRRRSGASHE